MIRSVFLFGGFILMAAILVEQTSAQAKPGTARTAGGAAAARTTQGAIYTMAQAKAGENTYYTLCISCHPKGTYAGAGFKTNWNGRPLWELYDWVLNKMPKNDPGSLTPDESVQVLAYILQQNKMPAGKTPLPANDKALYAIKIQIK